MQPQSSHVCSRSTAAVHTAILLWLQAGNPSMAPSQKVTDKTMEETVIPVTAGHGSTRPLVHVSLCTTDVTLFTLYFKFTQDL